MANNFALFNNVSENDVHVRRALQSRDRGARRRFPWSNFAKLVEVEKPVKGRRPAHNHGIEV